MVLLSLHDAAEAIACPRRRSLFELEEGACRNSECGFQTRYWCEGQTVLIDERDTIFDLSAVVAHGSQSVLQKRRVFVFPVCCLLWWLFCLSEVQPACDSGVRRAPP